jgi:long-chain acyl-CoA synthetase
VNAPSGLTPLPFWQLDAAPTRVAVIDEHGRAHSYAALAQAADVRGRDLLPRSVFALAAANTWATVVTLLAALRRGAVPLLMDPELPVDVRNTLLRRYGLTRVFDGRYDAWEQLPADGTVPEPVAHAELGLLLSTSGSTASPKLVRLSRDNLAANAGAIVQYLELNDSEVALTTLPLHYSYGLSVLNSHLACGACVVLSSAAVTQAGFWRAMREHGVTSLSGVPTLWRLLRQLRFERMDLPALRTYTQAGGRLEPDEVRWLADVAQARQCRLFVMYGQTEAAPRIAYLPPTWLPDKCGSVGVAVPGGTLRIVDEAGCSVDEPGVSGQLVYRGPNVMMGYAHNGDELALPAQLDELATGDLGHRDADGCFWITGRLKRFVKLHGHRISLDEVETALRQGGWEAGVVGRDDLLQVAVVHADPTVMEPLQRTLAARYRLLPAVVRVRALDALPLGSNGKLQYAALQALLDAPPAAAKTEEASSHV